jgi:NADH-quinone oxidoreductase subunit L
MGQLTWIVLLPLLGFLVNGLIGRRLGPHFVSIVGCGMPLAAFAIVVMCFTDLGTRDAALIETAYRWASIGDRTFEIAFYFDRLPAVMTLIVTGVCSLIHMYSIGFM